MIGEINVNQVVFWLQTDRICDVHIEYYPKQNPQKKGISSIVKTYNPFENESTFPVFLAKVYLKTEPSTEYKYEVFLNKKK